MRVFFYLIGCFFTASSACADIVIATGPSFFTTVFQRLPENSAKKLGFKVSVMGDPLKLSSPETMQSVIEGKADAGVASSLSFDAWVENVKKAKPGITGIDTLTHRVIGNDKIRIATHKSVTLSELSDQQILLVFTGKIRNWKELGGPNLPVKLVIARKQEATTNNFVKALLKGAPIEGDKVNVDTADDALKALGETPGGVTVLSWQLLKGDFGFPKHRTIGRPMILITKGRPSEQLLKFINYINENRAAFQIE